MTTLDEIEAAAAALPKEEQKKLLKLLEQRLSQNGVHGQNGKNAAPEEKRLSIRDMLNNPLSVGEILRPFGPDDDFFGEMMEDRKF